MKYYYYDGYWCEGTHVVQKPTLDALSEKDPVTGAAALLLMKKTS
jgi:hypothetical protein